MWADGEGVQGVFLQMENVIPFFPDKVPGQRHSHDISSNILDGGDGVLPADLCGIQRVLQVPDSKGHFQAHVVYFWRGLRVGRDAAPSLVAAAYLSHLAANTAVRQGYTSAAYGPANAVD